ncbi:beta-lactamase/transpeptidase-like protein [Hypoxylon rubiginosum]|uniref:Beta-lactamase/transpeptidase-like protein n=1 Tax=Hypoxylon rubiginosum TaxID=110542 RepID=A0ACC0CIM3_9PEZI|nr:beta-lactamase/transpeptidase-like protein [Hypoxylon rubiginosum]
MATYQEQAGSDTDHQSPAVATKAVFDRLQGLEPRIQRILKITGIPGCSIGVIHKGVEVWKFNAGFRDVENKLPTRSDTVFNLNSLTKGITAAAFACLVHDGNITWETPIKSIIPEFAQGCDEIDQSITPIDMLSMRTGHHALNCMAWQGSNIVLPDRKDTIEFWNATPRLGTFRSYFRYNNWGYGITALIIEKLAQQPFHEFLKERIFDPLNLKRTKMEDGIPFDNNAISYAMQADRSPVRVPDPTIGVGIFTQGGSGVISTIDDMLILYYQYLLAINDQFRSKAKSTAHNPFVECATLVTPHNNLANADYILREQSYGCGWIRCQLPGPLGMIGMNADFMDVPNVLEGGPSHLCLYHMGMMVGSTSNIALVPETETVVAILANASPLGDGADWISQMIMEAIFDPPTKHDYERLAEEMALKVLDHIPSIGRELEQKRVPGTQPSFATESYTGTFKHDKTPFKIGIGMNGETKDLTLTFNGHVAETYPLKHYHNDTFSWWVPFNDASRRGRFLMFYAADTFLINFEGRDRFTWVSGDIGKEPYVFNREK